MRRWVASATSCSSRGSRSCLLTANRGEVVRFYLTDTANTRVFKVVLPGARIKLVGGDSGRYEHEEFVEEVVLAPSERVVIDVLFDEPGQLTLEHRTPDKTYTLATIDVSDEPASPSYADRLQAQRTAPELAAERERLAEYLEAEPDKTLASSPRWTSRRLRALWSTRARCIRRSSASSPAAAPARDEAHAGGDNLHLPHASRGGQPRAWPLPGVRDEAPCRRSSSLPPAR